MKKLSFLLKVFILTSFTFFVSCDKEEFQKTENKAQSTITETKINYNSFSNKLNKNSLNNSFVAKNKSQLSNARLINYNGLLINTDEILEINNQGNITYTFNVKETGNYKDLINLVINVLENGDLEEKIIVYRNYFINNLTNDILVIKLNNTTNALARLQDISGDMTCYEAVSTCNLGGFGHYEGHPNCTHGSSWYITFNEVTCPPTYADVSDQTEIISDTSGNESGGAGPYYFLYTPCSQSASTGNNQTSNVNQSNEDINNDTNTSTSTQSTTKPLLISAPINQINFTEQEQLILDLHPNLTSLLNNFLNQNPNNEEAVKGILNYLTQLAINDVMNDTNEYKSLMCGSNNEEPLNPLNEIINTLNNGECVILPNIFDPIHITAPYNPNLFGDYPAPSIQQNHDAIQQQFNNLRNSQGDLAAVNYLINTYNMNTFGTSATITFNYSVTVVNGLPNGDHGRAILGYNSSGTLVACELKIDTNLLSFNDFGYITRVIKHELLHILQAQIYGQHNPVEATREFDAYFNQIFAFHDLKQIQDLSISCGLAKYMINFMNQMPQINKDERVDMIKRVNDTFPKVCPE